MENLTIDAQPRNAGKGASRAVRRQGNVPCVLYGSNAEPVVFQVTELALKPLIYTAETHIVNIEVGSDSWECILKDVAFHPVTDRPMHADFQVLEKGQVITLSVPVNYEGTPKGKSDGGVINIVLNELEVRVLPKNIPSHITVDISDLGVGDTIHIGDLELEGIEFTGTAEQTLVTIVQPRRVEEEEDEDGVLGLSEAVEEGDEDDEDDE